MSWRNGGGAREGLSEELAFRLSQLDDIKQGWGWGQRSAEGEEGRARLPEGSQQAEPQQGPGHSWSGCDRVSPGGALGIADLCVYIKFGFFGLHFLADEMGVLFLLSQDVLLASSNWKPSVLRKRPLILIVVNSS